MKSLIEIAKDFFNGVKNVDDVEQINEFPTSKDGNEILIANTKENDGDGITHINISILGNTELGKQLAHFSPIGFTHPHYGPFNSMEGFWHYINSVSRDDKLRHLIGRSAKKHSKTLTKTKVVGFQEIIKEANFYRIEQNPELKKMFVESSLPFDYYYYYNNGPVAMRPRGHAWIAEMYEELRRMMKEGKRPEPLDYTKVGQPVT